MRKPERRELADGSERWRIRFRHQGKETSETFRLKKDAASFAAALDGGGPTSALEWLAARKGATAPKVAALTFGTWFDTYVNQLTGVTSRTRDDYRRVHNRYLTGLDPVPLGQINRTHVTTIVNDMEGRGLSPKTIKNTVYMLAGCLSLAVDEGHLLRNPTKRVRLPKMRTVEDEERFLTHEEFGRLYEAMADQYKPLLVFMVGTGLRWSEVTALEVRHIDLAAGTVRVAQAWKKITGGWEIGPPKADKSRRTVNAATLALLAAKPLLEGKKPTDLVFTTSAGYQAAHLTRRYSSDGTPRLRAAAASGGGGGNVIRHSNFYNNFWVPACVRAGLVDPRPSPHDLRHTHASWLISDGASLEAVQDQLGHESILTTRQVYGKLLPAVGIEVGRMASAAMERALAGTTQPLQIEAP